MKFFPYIREGVSVAILTILATGCFAAPLQTITLNLKDAPVNSVLAALGKESGLNIRTSKDIKGNITIQLKDVSPIEALQAITKKADLHYVIDNDEIKISAIKRTESQKQEEPRTSIISRAKGVTTRAFSINNTDRAELIGLLTNFVPEIKKMSSIGTGNLIVIEAPDASMSKIEKIIGQIDNTPNQVIVEAQVMEINAGNDDSMGINMLYGSTAQGSNNVQTVGLASNPDTTSKGFYANLYKGKVSTVIQALASKTGYNLLANPKILASSGKSASIIAGDMLGYKTLGAVAGPGGSVVQTETMNFLEVGTKLTFTPYIFRDGTIKMEIRPEISEGEIVGGVPLKRTTEATTVVFVKDGETIIIGGLIKNRSQEGYDGVPVVMNIPYLGNFFKKKTQVESKREIIVVLTPHLITPTYQNNDMKNEVDSMREKQESKLGKELGGIDWWIK